MILVCPSCHARFSVADHLVPPGGRTVRCSKCAHAWHVERTSFSAATDTVSAPAVPKAVAPAAAAEVVIPDFSALEAQAIPRRRIQNPGRRVDDKRGWRNPLIYKLAAPAFALVWLVLAFIAYAPSWAHKPGLSGLYHALGSLPTEGLAFADVNMAREQEGNKTKFILSGTVRNNASVVRVVPTVRVQLKDKQNKTVWEREYPVNLELKAGDRYPFRITNVETAFAKSVARIVVDMGSPMQLMVR